MRISGIVEESIVDGPGIRTVIFMQGCPHACPGCHNPETHDFRGGQETSLEDIRAVLERNPYIDGVTLSGGDPLARVFDCLEMAKLIKHTFSYNLWIYTGFTIEEIFEKSKSDPRYLEVLSLTDVLVDGPYIEARRDLSLRYRGSDNQRIITVPATLKTGRICLLDI